MSHNSITSLSSLPFSSPFGSEICVYLICICLNSRHMYSFTSNTFTFRISWITIFMRFYGLCMGADLKKSVSERRDNWVIDSSLHSCKTVLTLDSRRVKCLPEYEWIVFCGSESQTLHKKREKCWLQSKWR